MRTLPEPIENYMSMGARQKSLNDALHRPAPSPDEMLQVGRPPTFQQSPSNTDMRQMDLQNNQSGYGQMGQQNPMRGQGQGLAGGDPRMGVIQANIQGHIIPPEGSDRGQPAGMGQISQMMGLGNQLREGQGLKFQPAPSDPQRPSAGQPVGTPSSQLDDARRSGYMTGGKTMSSMIREGLLQGLRRGM